MKRNEDLSTVRELMTKFAEQTGLASQRGPRRYLWTDAFAVCNFLELFRRTGEDGWRDLTLRLVEQVHTVLGRHREDDPRRGWISGLDEQEGIRHPTAGGLRIGKELNERRDGESFDERLEWERDGQYYHYLTKWMHALNRVSRVTGDETCNAWAMELAKATHAAFVHTPAVGGPKRMYWKMSINLRRPLVPSMGQHDPLDGLITFSQLQQTADDFSRPSPRLNAEIAELEEICREQNWVTADPLGIGGLLCDAGRMVQLMLKGVAGLGGLLDAVLDAARTSLQSVAQDNFVRLPADYRLAFRELGLAIGLRAIERLPAMLAEGPGLSGREKLRGKVSALLRHAPLAEAIEAFWTDEGNRQAGSWREHLEINEVMLATSLAPEGFVCLWNRCGA